MTRRHFEAAAVIAAEQPNHEQRLQVADAFCKLFEQFNSRFDRSRFYGKVGQLAGAADARDYTHAPASHAEDWNTR